jgi:hypothetical protein
MRTSADSSTGSRFCAGTCGRYPLTMRVTALTVQTELTNVVKENIKSEGGLIYSTLDELGHLGTYEVLYTKVTNEGHPCFSEEGGRKDPEGEVLTKGTWHLVYTSLASLPQGLQLGLLALASPVTIKCGAREIGVKGDLLASVDTLGGTEAEEYVGAGGILKGNGEGLPNIKFFYNEAGTSVKVKLEANFGTGFQRSGRGSGRITELDRLQRRDGCGYLAVIVKSAV